MKAIIRQPNAAEEKRKVLCAEQMAADRRQLLLRWPFIGGIIIRMELVPVRDDRLSTACTDGNTIFADIDFYSALSSDERLFVLAHEVWHCVFLHFARRGTRKKERFNIAADLEIHFALQSEQMKEPFVLPHDPHWAGLSAEEIYERLSRKTTDCTGGGKKRAREIWGDGPFDRHVYPDDRSIAEEEPGGSGPFVLDRDFAPAAITENTAEQIRGRLIGSAQQTEKMHGTIPRGAETMLEKLRHPVLPWRDLLRQFVTSCCGGSRRWLPPARRHVWQNLYLPSMRSERLNAVVGLDTSGSTADSLDLFFGEISSLIRTFGKYELTAIQCDAAVQNVEVFSDEKPLPDRLRWTAKGGGGTDFNPVFDYVSSRNTRPDLLLFFTDGYGTAPVKAPPYPVLWVLTRDGRCPAQWGKTIHFQEGEEK